MKTNTDSDEVGPRMRVFLSSIGRRNYLVRWFREAAPLVGDAIEIWGGEGDPHAPGLIDVDKQVLMPPIASDRYVDRLVETCVDGQISLLVSLQDYDIARISDGVLERLQGTDIAVAVPPKSTLDVVSDKLLMVDMLREGNLRTPSTTLATSDTVSRHGAASVVKHRFGSGSSGVFIVGAEYLKPAITMSAISAPQADGTRPSKLDASLVVVQEKIEGEEFGLDVVCDFQGNFKGVLARKKLRMRAGETDRAITVDPAPFKKLGSDLAGVLDLRGNTDVDVIVSPEGDPYVIDINPRFGGGYPFVHMAGANVPACYLAWTVGRDIDPSWLDYELGVVSSKLYAVQRTTE